MFTIKYRRLCLVLTVALSAGCTDGEPEKNENVVLSDQEALIAQGRNKARICTGCHGPNGISRIPSNPSLAGLSQDYLVEQLHAFREGSRENPTMNSIARNLTDADIAALAAYFSSLPGAGSQ